MSVDITTLGLEVKSDGVATASDRLDNLTKSGAEAEGSANKLTSSLDKLGYSTQSLVKYLESAAAAFAAWELAKKANEAALLAARYETLGVVMTVTGKNAAYSSAQMLEFQASLQKTGISAIESRNGLIRMGQAQIDMANAAKLARVAQDAAVVGNINSSEAFERMMTGLATGQSIILHHLGLMTNFEQAYVKAAAAMGKTTADLTETEKAQVRVNEVMRASVGIQGAYEAAMGTVGKQITSLPRYIQDLMVKIGEMGQGPLYAGVVTLTDSLKYLNKNFDQIASTAGSLGTGAAIVGIGVLTSKVEAFTYQAHVAQLQTIALRDNTLFDAAAAVTAAESRNAEAVALANSTRVRMAAIDAQIAETKAAFWASSVYQERVALDAQLIALEQARARVVGELAVAESATATTAEALAVATQAEAVAMSEASLASRAMAGAMAGLNTTLALIGGPIGAIAIAIAGLTYEVIKFMERADEARTKLAQMSNQGDFSQMLQKLKEIEDLNRKLEQEKKSPADVAKENTAAMQEKINKAVKENVQLEQQRQALIASGKNTSAKDKFFGSDPTEWDKVNAKIKDNNNLIQYGMRVNQEMNQALAKQAELRKAMHQEPPKPSDIDPEAQARYNKQLADAENALTQAKVAKDKQIEDAALKDRLERLQQEKDAGLKTTAEYLNEKYALERASLQKGLDNANKLADARFKTVHDVSNDPGADLVLQTKAIEEYTKALQSALKIKEQMDASTVKKVGDNAQLQRDQEHFKAEMNIQRLQEQGWTRAAEEAANQLKYDDMKKKGYTDEQIALQRVNDEIKYQNDLYAQQIAQKKELDALKAENAATSASLVGTNASGRFDTIGDQTANQLAQQKTDHEQRMKLIQDEQDANLAALMAQQKSYQDYIDIKMELDKKAAKENIKNTKATTAITQTASDSQLDMVSKYVGQAGQLFSGLAGSMDQSSRAGFESAKAFAMAATVMNTAAAVMNALANVPYPYDIAVAATAAATGAMQLGVIASTQYGGKGGAPVGISAGSFGGGAGGASATVGSKIGAPIQYGVDAVGTDQMAKLAQASDSAALAVGDLTASFKAASKVFSSGGIGESQVDRLIGIASGHIDPSQAGMLQQAVNGIVQQGIDTITKAAISLGTTFGTPTITPVGWQGGEWNKENVEKTMNAMVESVMNDYAKAVKGLEEYAKPGEDASAALQRLSGALYTVDKEFDKLGITLLQGLSGANIASKLQDAFAAKGEDLSKAMDNYFTGLFTDEQQKAMKAAEAQRAVDAAFSQMGIAVPKTNAQFIALVNSLDLTTAQGQSTFATLMSVSDSFGTMTKQAEEFRKAQQELNDALSVRYLKATGQNDAATILDLQIQQANELRDAQEKGLDTTQLVIVQALELAQAQQQIADTAAAAQKALADKSNSLNIQIMQLSGDTVGATALQRQMELAAMDASLRPLQERVYALQDEKAAADAAATASKNAMNAAMTVLQKSVQAAKDATQSAYNDQVAAINAAKDAQAAAYQVQEKAAQDYVAKLTATAGSIKSALDSVLGNGGDTLMSRKAAESQIHWYAASGKLPMNGELDGALKAITQPSEGFFSTLADYKRDAAKTANDLSILNSRAQGQLSNAQLQLQALQDANDLAKKAFDNQEKAAKDAFDAQNKMYDATLAAAQAQVDAANGTTVAVMSVTDAVNNLANAMGIASLNIAPTSSMVPEDRSGSDFLLKYGLPQNGAADNRGVETELRSLRTEMKAALSETVKANKKMAKYIEMWDGNGMPETRAV